MAKWIITDIDGCISPEESIPWETDTFMRLAHLIREANAGRSPLAPFTFCTGRPQPYVEALAKLLGVTVPAVCESGAVLYTLEGNLAEYGPGVTAEKIAGLREVRGFIEREILPAFPTALVQFGKEAQISVFSERPEIFGEVQARIERFVERAGGPALHISPSHFYLNLSLDGVDKGSALREVLRRLGTRRAETAGIGDTEGDLFLRDAVGFFACPANATAPIKAVADYVSPYPLLEGMFDILARPEFQRD